MQRYEKAKQQKLNKMSRKVEKGITAFTELFFCLFLYLWQAKNDKLV